MEDLKIVYLSPDALTPYERNARRHGEEDVKVIENSIRENGFCDPIGIWGENNLIVEGHGRLLAAKNLGLESVPCIRLDHLTEEQRREYALTHNRSAELSMWDEALKKTELESILNIDMTQFGFESLGGEDEANPYTNTVKIPQYDVKGELVTLSDLYDRSKADELIRKIDEAEGIEEDVKKFLRMAAERHVVFYYREIAEYYASASPEVQQLMEDSALVIIDYNDAIADGYVRLSKRMRELAAENA